MRQVTATEKYYAVLEGKIAKKEFVRQMRQQYPMYISQYNGFDDTVQILKNRQMIFEAQKPAFSEAKVYDDRPALTYSLDALDRGIRIELQTMGIDMAAQTVKGEDFKQAEKKAKDNLEKDANHYLNLMAGESNKVDKHDKEKEVKRGAADKDTFNDMKKATLKENMHIDDEEWEKEMGRTPEDTEKAIDKEASKMSEDAKKNLLGKVVGALRTKYPDITAGILKDFIKTHYQDLLDGADIEDEFAEYISVNYEGPSDMREKKVTELKDVTDGRDIGEKIKEFAGGKNVDVHVVYYRYKSKMFYDIPVEKAIDITNEYIDQNDLTQADTGQKDYILMIDDGDASIDIKKADGKKWDSDEIMALVSEKKGKDHDGDGDIDGDDYMAAKDKAIKKATGKNPKEEQLKEAIKSIIKKTLNEDTINEAATSRLSQKMEEFGGYSGAQGVINSLENIVTEVESFYGKVREKIQKVYDDMGNIENEEGLKIGQFIGPAIESAFMQDLRPVTKKGFTQDLQLPKAKQIDPEMLAQARAAGEVDEAPEEPKTTVFSPNF